MSTSNTITLAKAALRKDIKTRLAQMGSEDRRKQSSIVTDMVLQSSEYRSSRRVCVYLSLEEEVSTADLLKHIFSSGRQCFVPRYSKEKMEMLRLFSMEDYQNLPLTKWNIKQPEPAGSQNPIREEALATGGLDLIILPGLGFSYDKATSKWVRLGRGKGYYDTYLEQCLKTKNPPITIALAYQEQIVDSIPSTEQDIPVEKVFVP